MNMTGVAHAWQNINDECVCTRCGARLVCADSSFTPIVTKWRGVLDSIPPCQPSDETADRRCYICFQEDPDGRKRHVIIQGKKYRIEWDDSGIISVDLKETADANA